MEFLPARPRITRRVSYALPYAAKASQEREIASQFDGEREFPQ
jgi:hypothetical protein